MRSGEAFKNNAVSVISEGVVSVSGNACISLSDSEAYGSGFCSVEVVSSFNDSLNEVSTCSGRNGLVVSSVFGSRVNEYYSSECSRCCRSISCCTISPTVNRKVGNSGRSFCNSVRNSYGCCFAISPYVVCAVGKSEDCIISAYVCTTVVDNSVKICCGET